MAKNRSLLKRRGRGVLRVKVQKMNEAWIQQVVFGLAAEWSKQPKEVLKARSAFHKNLVFNTEWAQQMFSREDIERKIAEATELLELLETKPVAI